MIFVCRTVTSPEWARRQGWLVVTQHPGQLLGSRLPHCVTGVSLWSVAWNTCCAANIPKYVKTELAMASYLRTNLPAQELWDKSKRSRVVISPAILCQYVESSNTGNKPLHYDMLEEGAKLLKAGA